MNVSLRLVERPDLPLLHTWMNDIDFVGEFESFGQRTLAAMEKAFDNPGATREFLIQRKAATPLGYIAHFDTRGCKGIGYMLLPAERGKGYGSEAVQIMLDYLFLNHDAVRIQAETHPDNAASQRVLQKAGFTREGLIRKAFLSRGVYRDIALWSILREEWKSPRILPLGYIRSHAEETPSDPPVTPPDCQIATSPDSSTPPRAPRCRMASIPS